MRRVVRYSDAEAAFIEHHKDMARVALHAKFIARFDRPEVSCNSISYYCRRKGWFAPKGKLTVIRMHRQHLRYDKAELSFLSKNRHLIRRELHARFVAKFHRDDVSIDNLVNLCRARRWLTGRASVAIEWSRSELLFLKRNRHSPRRELHSKFVGKFGRAVTLEQIKNVLAKHEWFTHRIKNAVPIGAERSEGGYILIKTNSKNSRTPNRRQWVLKHYLRWEEINGAVPRGCVLKCLDGNRTNTAPSNWACVPSGVINRLRKRNFNDAPTNLRPTIITVSKLEHALNERKR